MWVKESFIDQHIWSNHQLNELQENDWLHETTKVEALLPTNRRIWKLIAAKTAEDAFIQSHTWFKFALDWNIVDHAAAAVDDDVLTAPLELPTNSFRN